MTEATTTPSIEQLRRAVEDMDGLSQEGFSEISAVAALALKSMETPDTDRHPEHLAQALKIIWSKAEDIQNCINAAAEQVGCNYKDDAQRRRMAAYRQREAGHD